MRKVLICLLVLCVYVTSAFPHNAQTDPQLDPTWEQFKSTYQKNYDDNSEMIRRMIWEENLKKVRLHNLQYDLGHKTYSMGMNEYADMTTAEFRNSFFGYRPQKTNSTGPIFRPVLNVENLPKEVDWRKKGYVTPVKDQKTCGSCYAFSATGSLEGQHFRKTGKLLSLSEQQIVDCTFHNDFENGGCCGGSPQNSFEYIKSVGGIESEKSYPYINKYECHSNKSQFVATCSGYVQIGSGSERSLQEAVATFGPVSVGIDASLHSFRHYKHGIYDEPKCSSEDLDHAVLVVGYGFENGVDYWLVKNSWGTSFGAEGYIKMSRNKNNQCGIATEACYPTV